jgi:hypothetical protein
MSDTIKPATPPPPWTHTPGPWEADGGDTSTWWAVTLPTGGYVIADLSDSSYSADQDAANARRIVACVNALEGVDDPAAVVSQARTVLAAALNYLAAPDAFTREERGMLIEDVADIVARLGG